MKYLKKKKIIPQKEETGEILQSIDTENKITTAPSTELFQQLVEIPMDGIMFYNDDTPEGYIDIPLTSIISLATTTQNGLMSSEDKQKLEGFEHIKGATSLPFKAQLYDQPTGISEKTNLSPGTYIVQMRCNFAGEAGQWDEYYSGIMAWSGYQHASQGGNSARIRMHHAGHAPNSQEVRLYVMEDGKYNGYAKSLMLDASQYMNNAKNVIFKLRKIM